MPGTAATVKELLNSTTSREDVLVQGWVRTRRDAKGFSFIEVNDGSGLHNLQVIAQNTLPNYSALQRLTTGSSIRARGALTASQGKGTELGVDGDLNRDRRQL